jgi:hypothetical protein
LEAKQEIILVENNIVGGGGGQQIEGCIRRNDYISSQKKIRSLYLCVYGLKYYLKMVSRERKRKMKP